MKFFNRRNRFRFSFASRRGINISCGLHRRLRRFPAQSDTEQPPLPGKTASTEPDCRKVPVQAARQCVSTTPVPAQHGRRAPRGTQQSDHRDLKSQYRAQLRKKSHPADPRSTPGAVSSTSRNFKLRNASRIQTEPTYAGFNSKLLLRRQAIPHAELIRNYARQKIPFTTIFVLFRHEGTKKSPLFILYNIVQSIIKNHLTT